MDFDADLLEEDAQPEDEDEDEANSKEKNQSKPDIDDDPTLFAPKETVKEK